MCSYVMEVLAGGTSPTLLTDTLGAIKLASHLSVLLLSDDNISTEVSSVSGVVFQGDNQLAVVGRYWSLSVYLTTHQPLCQLCQLQCLLNSRTVLVSPSSLG